MSKSTSMQIAMLVLYATITIAFVAFNAVTILNSQKLEKELESVTRKYDDKKELAELTRNARSEWRLAEHQLGRVNDRIPKLLAGMDAATLESSELFSDELTTIVVHDAHSHRHGVRVYTTETTKLELVYNVSHRIAKPKPRVSPAKNTKEIKNYEFVFPIQPKVWNIFTMVSEGRGEVPVFSIVDGESDIVGTLPEFRTIHYSKGNNKSFTGILKPDANGICCEFKPFKNIKISSSDPDASEMLQLEITIRLASE